MKKSFKRVISTFLAVLFIVGLVPLSGLNITASAEEYSGTCGENLTWMFDDEVGSLVISGTGKMYDYSANNRPWEVYEDLIQYIEIINGVTSIGKYAFNDFDSLVSVTIPNSVTIISDRAFEDCDMVTVVAVPDSVINIGLYAFSGCDVLESIVLGSGVKRIDAAFYGCDALDIVYYTGDIAEWCKIDFSGKTANPMYYADDFYVQGKYVIGITIPDSVTSICNYAFIGCTNLLSVEIPDSVTSIGDYAFADCVNLASITIPNGVINIDAYAFSGCDGLTNITIGNSVSSIEDHAFYLCDNLTDVYFMGTRAQWNEIAIGEYNDALLNATIHFLGEEECDHSYTSKVTIEPTYTTEGERTYTCEKCGDTYTEVIPVVPYPGNDDAVLSLSLIEETDTHILLGVRVVKGCIAALDIGIYQQGDLIGQCSDMYLSEYVDRLMDMKLAAAACNKETCLAAYAKVDGLDVGEYILFAEFEKKANEKVTENDFVLGISNCCDPNFADLSCSVVYDFSSNHKHSYTSEVTKEQTCTKDGIITYTCSCGNTYTEIIPKDVHSYTSKVTIEPTSTTEGEKTYTCEKCGDTYTEVIPKKQDHDGGAIFYLNIVEETSDKVKLEVYLEPCDCVVSNFDLGVFEQSDKISDCVDLDINDIYFLMEGYNVTRLIAGVHVNGVNVPHRLALYTFTKRTNENVDINDFDLVVTNFGSYCCGDYTVIKNLPEHTEPSEPEHNFNHIVVPSTCTVAGMEYDICSDCGEVINSKVLPLASHTLSHVVVASTCTVEGMEYDICSVCGGTFNTEVLPLAPHSWSEWKIVREATAALEGLKERSCTVCGTTEEELIPKLNVIVDDESGILIEFNDEYDSGVEIKVDEVFDGNSFQILDLKYGNTQSVIFDITTVKDGEKVQPDGKVKVRIPLPAGFDTTKLFVCYVDSTNGTVTPIPATVVNGYVEFETDHFSYYAIVEKLGKVNSVSIGDVSISYKDSATITPNISVDAGVDYTVTYSSSNTDVVSIDANGKLTTNDKGSATITVTVTDEYGNTVTDTCKVNVSYKWWQWIIVIVLFGWIWY